MIDLSPILARAERATTGRWISCSLGTPKGRADARDRSVICSVMRQEAVFTDHHGGTYPSSDMDFIAHARTDVPAMAAEIASLRAALNQVLSATSVEEAKRFAEEALK